MRTEGFKGALLSILLISALIVPVVLLSSPSPVYAALTSHAPIYINGNGGFTKPDPVNGGGSGTLVDPYIIENWDINAENAHGIEIRNTTAYFVIRNCYVHDGGGNYSGIYLDNVANGEIDNNLAENNNEGIHLWNSDNNVIKNCTAENNYFGIDHRYSSNTNLRNTALSNNVCNLNIWGDEISEFYQDIDTSNEINGKPIYYVTEQENLTFDGNIMDVGYLGLVSCKNIQVKNLNMSNNNSGIQLVNTTNSTITNCVLWNNNWDGIVLFASTNNRVENCTAKNNWSWYGILLRRSENNIVTNCIVENNGLSGICLDWDSSNNIIMNCTAQNNTWEGIRLSSSNNNHIYHNNIVNNATQARDDGSNYWDDSYPSGGNYWSDYTGVDNYRSENQDIPGSDGIGDTPYYIPGDNNRDRYPLMYPYLPAEVIVRGKDTAYNVHFTGDEPWTWYVEGDRPPIMAAKRVGAGAVVAAGTVATCRDNRWTLGEWDVLLDKAFQWMVPGAENVLWYEGYNVFNDTFQCSDLISALENLGYSVTGDNTEPITSSLLSPYDILVIPQLQLGDQSTGGDPSLLPDADVQAIENFVEGGKGLLIMEQGDYGGYNFYKVQNEILRALNMGIYFQIDEIYDDTNNWADPWFPIADVDPGSEIGAAYQAATGKTDAKLFYLCSLAEPGHVVSISPSCRRGLPGQTLEYTVKILNMSKENNTYGLTVSDNENWGPWLEDNLLAVPAWENRSTTLTVTIPLDASIGAKDNILVTASAENVEKSDWCLARMLGTVDEAIDDGVAWLAGQQNPDGSWGTGNMVAKTGLAVLKLTEHAVDAKYGYGLASPFDPEYPYREHVERGLNYLYASTHIIDIDNQPAGNPDTNGNSKGIYFGWGLRTYETGIAMMAIAGSRAPDRVVSVSGSPVDNWEYKDVLQDAVDYFAWGQTDWGYGRGGWNYQEMVDGGDRSDQSNTGWAVFGLGFAESPAYGFACTIPPFLKTELNIWIDYIQNPVDGDPNDGGAGYSGPYWANTLRTGHLLYMMTFVGDTAETPRVENAIDYLVRHWNDPNVDPGWRGAPGEVTNYQATFTVMKGLTALGIHEIDGINWQSEFENMLLAQQLYDGSWPKALWDSEERILSTEWVLLTLQKVVPPPAPLATIDIDPDTLNLRSKGKWITCYIELPSGYSVENIDVGTVMLLVDNDNVPAEARPTDVGDHDNDGIADRMVKFSRSAVQALASIGEFEATVVGEVAGLPFEGSDTIRVIDFGTDTLYQARLGVDLNLDNGQGLALRFYAYSGAFQGENVLWDGAAPAHVVFIENVPHPEGRPIQNVALVLTENTENVISTVASFVVRKIDIEKNFMRIPLEWALAQTPEERLEIEMEFMEKPLYWALAPS